MSWVAANEHAGKSPQGSASGAPAPPQRPSKSDPDLQLKTADLVDKYITPVTEHAGVSFMEAVCSRALDLGALEVTAPLFAQKFCYTDLQAALVRVSQQGVG